ncbi:MAG: DNA adenine methylase [Bulleidia sp.]|nr:DNA adenine methylase [Bulleidia sp.]
MNPSPLRYPGGKYKLYNYVKSLIEVNGNTTYIEPFCGGSAISLKLLFNHVVKKVIINDYDYTIYCFWYSILNETDAFINMIINTEISIKEWEKQKEIRNNLEKYDILEIGFSTFFLNRTNRSGIIDKAGPIGGKRQTGSYSIDCRFNKDRLIKQIKKIALFKDKIQLYNLEAVDFIDQVIVHTKNSFIFFDPPYYSKGPGLYTNFYSHEDHVKLAKCITNKLKRRTWIVTYDNVEQVKDMYKKVDKFDFELQYTLQEKKHASEVMFFSKCVIRPENENEIIRIL